MMGNLNPHQKFLLELQHIIGKHRNDAAASEQHAAKARENAGMHQREAEAADAEAHRWQRLLDFAVLADRDNDLAHAFANAVLDRGSVDPFANVTTYYAERQAAQDDDGGALNDSGRDYAEEAWQRAEVEREGLEELDAEQAAKDAEAADNAMSASERFEHDQADEAKLDAEGWGQGGAPF